MSPWAKAGLTWIAVVTLVAVFFALRYEMVRGAFTSLAAVSPGICRDIAIGVHGPEDFEIDAVHNVIFVSSLNREAAPANSDPHDGLYLLKLDDPAAPPTKLAGTPLDFHPHGISLFRDDNGGETLMVIDHKPGGRQMIEIYGVDFAAGTPKLSQQSAIQSGVLVSPNDLAAIAPDRFYVTNDHVSKTALGRFAEDYLLWPHADVLAYNGMGFRIAAQRIAFPNGVLARGGLLYVTAMNERQLLAFSRLDITGDLTPIGALSLPARLDNISMDAAGNLIVAGQGKPGSAQVFRVRLGPDGVPLNYETLFSDDGHRLDGASSAAVTGGHLFIGSARDSKMLECDMVVRP
jgi:arylesterase/paraoxonase